MNGKSARLGLRLILALTFGIALSARPAAANPTLGMVTDNNTNTITIFNADTDTILGTVGPIPKGPDPSGGIGDCTITVDKRVGYVTNFNSEIFQVDLTQSPPVLRNPVNPIAISNLGEDLSLSPRGEYLLACDGAANTPVSVVLTQKRLQIGTFNLGSDCTSVDICSNARSTNSSVIVSSFNNNNVRRLRLDSSGKAVDTGDVLGGGSPGNTNCAPQGTAGVALHRSANEIQSFTIPGLAPVDTRPTTGGFPISGLFNAAGTIYFVRAVGGPSAVDEYGFNPATGALSLNPILSFPVLTNGSNTFFGMDQMALHPNQTKLYVSEPGKLSIYNATTGGPPIGSITSPNIVDPTGVCLR